MSAALVVEAPGPFTTLQDLGRTGHQAAGIPVSGALDPESLRLANTLVGNTEGEAALEMRLAGPTLKIAADHVRVALCGASSPLEIIAPERGEIAPWRTVRLERGAVIRVPPLRESVTAYLAVEGGFDAPEILGSRSTCLRAGFGGFEGRILAEGDRLGLNLDTVAARPEIRAARPPTLTPPERIRVVLGPQDDYFSEAGLATLLTAEFVVTKDADRMGLRLSGPRLEHQRGYNIVSDGIATGAIQVPGDGQPIVLLADHQTTGGYPKIATVISADLAALGRLAPGATVRFSAVTVEEAEAARAARERDIAALLRSLEPILVDPKTLSSVALLAVNLVSGVVDAPRAG
ncbi:biotin-dependent carboxyltransferase family protein [Pikeienuella piscinae]|uniref:Biotin-dependent carboxyltransferase family protein n=1 Tax=Pikeienuella piscinae TaxID=2748098 RepID=A0A7L5C062_9RHOB|nr:biotin-dependent carboxyltransferase family protein [Pikeienuella piscinae]QIE56763.1 biotin-dependent carboxyltransferase family protein [Pikeienuella piscinae]